MTMNRTRRGFRSPGSARTGMALFELVVVVLIIAVVGAIAAPRAVNLIRHQRLDGASRRIMADLALTRTLAIRDQASRTLTLSTLDQSYSLPPQVTAGAERVVRFNASPYQGVSIQSISYSPAEIVFSRLGLPQAGGTILLGDGVEQVLITISPTTGRATRVFQ